MLRDAVGHGTVTAGIAAGNGRAAAGGRFAGVAPDADLVIVKMTSDGVPAHDNQAAEQAFTACISQALDWVDQKISALHEPAVAFINAGVQLWGPADGSSAVSRKIDQYFSNRPGRVYVSATGDEGGLPTHAGGTVAATPTTVGLVRSSAAPTQLALWYSGVPSAEVTVAFADGATLGPIGPGQTGTSNGISITQYLPGQEFYPVTSIGGDHFVNIVLTGHNTTGSLTIQGTSATSGGKFDIYSDAGATLSFRDHLVAGRLSDFVSTRSAIGVGASVNLSSYTDIDGIPRQVAGDTPGALWGGSSGGPTRDGRLGVDIVTPGENVFAAYATTSYWSTYRFNLVQGGGGYYGRQGATSGAAPIAAGAAALMLQLNPMLTSEDARALLRSTATADGNTGATPNINWGYGKLSIPALVDRLFPGTSSLSRSASNPVLHAPRLRLTKPARM